MAIIAPTKLSDFNSAFLPPAIAAPIFERAAATSVVQSLTRQVPLAGNGTSVPYISGRPQAAWVAEGDTKPATSGTFGIKSIVPKKLAAILVVSDEVVRANPAGYLETMRKELADSFALSFDLAALHDAGPDGTAGAGPFSTYIDQATKVQEIGGTSVANGGIHVDLVEAMRDIVSDVDATGRRYRLSGWALDAVLEPALWGAVDTAGRPIYTELPVDANASVFNSAGRLLNRPSFIGEGVASPNLTSVVGYGGDWSQAAWGVVGGINFSISNQASVTVNGSLVSLWEKNLVAIRAEAEYGFLVNDVDAFTKLTNIGNSPVTSS